MIFQVRLLPRFSSLPTTLLFIETNDYNFVDHHIQLDSRVETDAKIVNGCFSSGKQVTQADLVKTVGWTWEEWSIKLRSWTCTAGIYGMVVLLLIFVVHGPMVERNGYEMRTRLLELNNSDEYFLFISVFHVVMSVDITSNHLYLI
ncbi:hypothetical protein BDQ12DRAFT_763497 [Crucibulum laeve]|uniref:Uncharacterized protein n=1 Tax=Crucibulum laeve TaxID=68775 RepID=A0A5C3LMJ1_9AGAR|nr:hypothetical protein BDQ12DRAFT_763497 [Crucibulum laeve]